MKIRRLIVIVYVGFIVSGCQNVRQDNNTIKGWNILTDNEKMASQVIAKSIEFDINHLQLSHQIVMDLKDVNDSETQQQILKLTAEAHNSGIEEVTIWDHCLYSLDYYPDEFKTGPDHTLNLDNPEFWSWLKNDYRRMLKKVPDIDGIILTFIETGAHIEDQYSEKLKTEEQKLATMVDTLASVIIDEFDLSLYIRTFIYTRAELSSLLKCIDLVKHPQVRVMTKEVPHDFFLTHPVSNFVSRIKSPTIIEFDAAHEYNGQGIISSIFPEIHINRWKHYSGLSNVIGYVARTDRKNKTSIINNPAEINLYAIERAVEEGDDLDIQEVYDDFIRKNYGNECIPYLKPAFKSATEIILSSLYTLGLPLNTHSRLDIENDGAYQRHVSGKWMDDFHVHIDRGVDTTLHYWSDIVNHLAPAWYKGEESNQLSVESGWVLDSAWLNPEERMNEQYLRLIMKEKQYGVTLATEAVKQVKLAKKYANNKAMYDTTLQVFQRTLKTVKLYEAVAGAYFGYRVYARGKEHQSAYVLKTIQQSLDKMPAIIEEILNYPYTGPQGQFIWREDAFRAMRYYIEFEKMENLEVPYDQNTFERFHYHGPFEDEKKEIHQCYQSIVKNVKQ